MVGSTRLAGAQVERARIQSIDCAPLSGESPKGGWSNEIRPDDSVHTLIAVHTDIGVTGYGSVFTNGDLVRAGLAVLEPLFAAENALEPVRVSEKLHQNSFWMGRGGTLTHVISGIDIALWDILGKVAGLSVATLLGGRHVEKVRPYCSLLMDEPGAMRDVLAEHKAQGYRAFKIGWGPFGRRDDAGLDEAIVRAARDEIGDDAALMIDPGGSDAFWPNGLKWALRTADMVAGYGVAWFEEALKPDDLAGFQVLRRQSSISISGGEVLTRRQSFLPFLSKGAFDIVQPDVTKVGGISEQKRIYELAETFGVQYVGHGWNTALGLAADLQMAAAFPNTDYVEYIGGSAYVDGILAAPFTLDDEGYLPIPDEPGLGVQLDRERVVQVTRDVDALRLP